MEGAGQIQPAAEMTSDGTSITPSVTTRKSLRMWSQALYMVHSRRTINNGHQLQECKFGVDIKKKTFPTWTVRQWNRFSRCVVLSPSLVIFKT